MSFPNRINPSTLLDYLLHQHLSWYPRMQVHDAYKLLYQGAMGPEHWISSPQEFAHYLEMEFVAVDALEGEHLVEPIRVDGTLLRLNLRAYKTHHDSVDLLIPLLLKTSHSFSSTKADLSETWQDFIQLCAQDKLDSFPMAAVEQFSRWLEKEDYPSVHHSEIYQSLYHPAYRLISARYLPALEAPGAV